MKLERLIPMQPVRQLDPSIDFYTRLGFQVEDRHDAWGWAMLRCGDCRLMLDQSIRQPGQAAGGSVLYFYPDDLAGFHRQARANGLAVEDIATTFYGMREFRIADPDGNRLWIGQADTHD